MGRTRFAGPAGRLRRAGDRLRRHALSVLLAGVAAGLAFALASAFFGTQEAFFAPIAAVVCVGITAGQRIRRAAEIAVGVAVGLTAADLLVRLTGAGPLQLGAAVVLAMALAVSLGTGSVLVNQAGVAAILVVALAPEGDANPLVRLGDALIGGGVALVLNAVVAPDPQRAVRRAEEQVMETFTGTLRQVVTALEDGDLERAERAQREIARLEDRLAVLDHSLAAARESARLGRRRSLRPLGPLLLARSRMDTLAVTVRSLTRGAANAVRHGRPVDPRVVAGVGHLAVAVTELQCWVEGRSDEEDVHHAALRAAGTASGSLGEVRGLTAHVLIGQLRSGAIDVLRATGLDQAGAVLALEEAAGRADEQR
ncbi:hypothetical protein GCM10009716_20190 [Streptomyces sodiiphilus]|uniref:Integral membrane bound transporter domain-containing protein n=1 Tax=Streptomyces sodiiphilus TaxID=226217 RepID=A0ABP5ACJ0_9ACTN